MEFDSDQAQEGQDEGPRPPSRSQLKRDSHAVQEAARRLLDLSATELAKLQLGPATLAAVAETARIKDRRAMPRHVKRVANLLEREDLGAISALLDARSALDQEAAARHHRVELWRDRLIGEGDAALKDFLDVCPGADRQHLRHLLRVAQRDREAGRPDGARKLFRALRDVLDT
ncbi:MAG TPA: ribosome biogenesis factor YjgA [Chromatiaceae bacterium]|nr:ribosome biogenesis factor YjgA [Chromatiaceae bacterium]